MDFKDPTNENVLFRERVEEVSGGGGGCLFVFRIL